MISEKIQQILESKIDNKKIFGAVLKIEKGNGDLVFEGAAGNISLNLPYFIASTTKLYTTAVIMKLVSDNQLTLETKLSDLFESSIITGLNTFGGQDYSDQITIKQLLSHTSGIPDYFMGKDEKGISLEKNLVAGNDQGWTYEEALERSKTLKPTFYPGQQGKALYSDTNFQLLGKVIEIMTKLSVKEAYDKYIFAPLSLFHSYYVTNIADIESIKPIPLYYKENPLYIPKAMTSFGPDGGIISTVDGQMTFIKAFFQGKLFPKEYITQMQSEVNNIFFPLQYGIGMMKFQLPGIFTLFRKYPPLWGHSGLSGAFAYYCSDKDLYFTGTVNQIAHPSISYVLLTKLLQIS